LNAQTLTIDEVKVMINMNDQTFDLIFNGKRCIGYRRVAEYCSTTATNYTFVMAPKLAGGVRVVVKKHITKENSIRDLQDKTKVAIATVLGVQSSADLPDIPQSLRAFITPMNEKFGRLQAALARSEVMIKPAIESLDDTKLNILLEILTKRGVLAEERILQMAGVCLPELDNIDAAKEVMDASKCNLIGVFSDAFAAEYNMNKGAGAVFDNLKLQTDIRSVQTYRRGIRAASGTATADDAVADGEDANRCVVM
jgi:hypothetical protein